MKIFKSLFLFLFLPVFQIGLSQSTIIPKIQSPNVAALSVYGDIPVSLFTGIPNINIPLYTIESGTIKVPIGLNYHANSVKPAQNPSWVGLGWNLNCAGVITRKVRGIPDEFSNDSNLNAQNIVPFFPCNTIQSGDSGSAVIENKDWYSKDWLAYKYTNHNGDFKSYDISSDEFSFNFLGHSGTFYYDKGKWIVVSDEHIIVEFNNDFIYPLDIEGIINSYNPITNVAYSTNISRTFKQFTLITDDGTRYTFGGNDALEFSASYSSTNPKTYDCNAYLLKKIENFKGDYVSFEYIRDYITCQLGYSGSSYSFVAEPLKNDFLTVGGSSSGNNPLEKDALVGQYIFPAYLSKISTKNQTISFTSSVAKTLRYTNYQFNQRIMPNYALFLVDMKSDNLQIKKLDTIIIKDNFNNVVKKINFLYNESDTERFTLTRLKEDNNKNYSFVYNDVAALPGLDGNNTDHWGFFNNIDILQNSQLTIFEKKQPVPTYLTKGLITNIIYPTGGSTRFTWEPHYYSKVVSLDRTSLVNQIGYAGGSRIFKIENFDANNSLLSQKRYYYLKNYNNTTKLNLSSLSSSGVLNGIPQYDFNTIGSSQYGSAKISLTLRNYNSLSSYGYSNGSYIGYDEVVEVNKDDSYRKHYFTNFGSDINGVSHYDQPPLGTLGWTNNDGPYMPSSSLEAERGKNIGIDDYNSVDVCVKKTKSVFRNDTSRFDNYIKQILNSGVYSSSQYDALIFASAFKKYTYNYYPVKNEVIVYDTDGLNPITTFTEYSYNSKNQLISEKKNGSKSEILENKTFYPFDLISGVQSNEMQQLVDANRVNYPVTIQMYNANQKISEQTTKFTKDPVKTNDLLLPIATYSIKGNDVIDIQKSDDRKITYDQYDDKGNLQQYTPESGVPVSIIWGYNKTQPIAKIENATYGEVASYVSNLQSKSDTGTEADLLTHLNALRTNLPNTMITTYTYKPLIGISTITDPRGYTTYYEYDSSNRLVLIKDQDSNILKTYCYNYQGQIENCVSVIPYKNIAKTESFTKNNCGAGYVSSSVAYTVPAGTYSSAVSQTAADNLAQADITANGQTYANTNGTCTLLQVPTGLAFVSATPTLINCSWAAVPGATGYKIYKDGVYGASSSTTFGVLGGLTTGVNYNIQVQAFNASGDGPLSAVVSMSTLLPAPTGLTLTSATTSYLNFSWTAVPGAIGYKVFKNGDSPISATGTTSSISGLTASTTYTIRVLAYNASGDGLSSSLAMTTSSPPMGVYKTSGTYPIAVSSSVNGSIVNSLTSPIYVYAVVQSADASSGGGSGGVSINGTNVSAGGTFTASGQNLISTSYATIPAGTTVTFSGGYGGVTNSKMILAYSLTPGGALTYWSTSN